MKKFVIRGFLLIFATTLFSLRTHALTVISDIDDTIKISNVLHKLDTVPHEFDLDQFIGMSETYNAIEDFSHPNFIYLSGGLRALGFVDRIFLKSFAFPSGSLILKTLRQAKEDVGTYKLAHLEKIFSSRNDDFILIGDNTEKDFSSYAEIANKYPGRVKQIYIHAIEITDLPAEAKAAHEITFLTAFDLAMNLYASKSINLDGLKGVAKAIEFSKEPEQIIPQFQDCPTVVPSVSSDDETASAIAASVDDKINSICTQNRRKKLEKTRR